LKRILDAISAEKLRLVEEEKEKKCLEAERLRHGAELKRIADETEAERLRQIEEAERIARVAAADDAEEAERAAADAERVRLEEEERIRHEQELLRLEEIKRQEEELARLERERIEAKAQAERERIAAEAEVQAERERIAAAQAEEERKIAEELEALRTAEEEEANRLFLEEEYYYCSDEYEIPDPTPPAGNLDYLLIHGPRGIELECVFDSLEDFFDGYLYPILYCSSNIDDMDYDFKMDYYYVVVTEDGFELGYDFDYYDTHAKDSVFSLYCEWTEGGLDCEWNMSWAGDGTYDVSASYEDPGAHRVMCHNDVCEGEEEEDPQVDAWANKYDYQSARAYVLAGPNAAAAAGEAASVAWGT